MQKRLEEITMDDLLGFQIWVQGKSKPATAAYAIIVLKNFFRFWNNRGVTHLALDEVRPPKFIPEPYHAVSELDFHMLDDFLATEPENFANTQKRLIIRLLWETGARIGELAKLNWPEVNQPEACCQIVTEKGNKKDWIFWSEETHRLLLKHIEQRQKYLGNWLFATYEGRMTARTIQRFLKKLGDNLGFDYELSPHCFRHGKAIFMEKNGADLLDIQTILRHKDPKSSLRYLIFSKDRIKQKANKYLQEFEPLAKVKV